MGLRLITGPTASPVSLAEAKAHLRFYGTEDDGLIAGYLMAATQSAEQQTNLLLGEQTWELTIDQWPSSVWGSGGVIRLPRSPVQSVTSISYVDADGVTQTVLAGDYVLDANVRPAAIYPAFGKAWPVTRPQANAVAVRFVVGYTQIPEPIRAAILLMVGHFYENREAVIVGQAPSELPMGVEALLFPFRVFY